MENSKRRPFEDQWQQAFKGAEAGAPSEGVWLSIDSTLTKAENARNKNRVVYYQRLAASLLLICVTSILITYWQWNGSPVEADEAIVSSNAGPPSETTMSIGVDPKSELENSLLTKVVKRNTGQWTNKNLHAGMTPILFPAENSVQEGKSFLTLGENNESKLSDDSMVLMNDIGFPEKKALTGEEEKELVKKLKDVIEEDEPGQKKSYRAAWATLGFAGGSYSPDASPHPQTNQLSLADPAKALSSTQPSSRQSLVGTSYSFGVMVGRQISKRWIVQTGFTYWKQRVDFESNIVGGSGLTATAYTADLVRDNGSSYTITTPYTLNSTTEFISLPVQFGYMLIDRKVGWILHAGVAPDLFLHNTLTDKSGNYKNFSQKSGENATYRTLSWSGLASTEVSIRLSERYRFALVPGVRYSFTDIVKDDSGSGKAVVLDVGFRFRYIFK